MILSAFLLLIFSQGAVLSVSTDDVDGVSSISTLVKTAGNNSIINIINITVLSSNVVLKHFENITIIGDYINCNSIGSVRFVSCNNVTIKSVSWTKCGTSANPTIEFYNSSNIVLCNCSFNNSTGQAVVLSKASGNVSINNCQFTHNKEYEGHGTAIQVPQPDHLVQLNVLINDCNFSFNGPAKSVVDFIGTPNYNDLIIQNSTFTQNQGVPIYISHTSLTLNNIVSFKNNRATAGGAIHANHSHIVFHGRSDVTFYGNVAHDNGGCLFLDNCNVSFVGNSTTNFINNTASNGSAVYSNYHTNIMFTDNSSVTFSDNYAQRFGGGVFCESSNPVDLHDRNATATCLISFNGSLSVNFINNRARDLGGAIFGHVDIITDGEVLSILFDNNYALFGAAIACFNSYITFNQINGSVNFTNHHPTEVIYALYSHIRFAGTSSVTFANNNIESQFFGLAGIITLRSTEVTFTGNSSVIFENNLNKSPTSGGAFSGTDCNIISTENASVTFIDNKSSQIGGAISIFRSNITLTGNTEMKFVRNRADKFGGAIFGDHSFIISNESSSLLFYNNVATRGGAIHVFNSNLSFNSKRLTLLINNSANIRGGAMHAVGSMITFAGLNKFMESIANDGGALYGHASVIEISGEIEFIHNEAYVGGGAIHGIYGSVIKFDEHAQVNFSRNVASNGAAVYISTNCNVASNGNSVVTFDSNRAVGGGAVYSTIYKF